MATFNILEQENITNAMNRLKENNVTKKRSVLGIINSNVDTKPNEIKKGLKSSNLHQTDKLIGDVHKPGINIKNNLKNKVIKPYVDNDIQPVQKAVKEFKIFEDTGDEEVRKTNNVVCKQLKNENKSRALKDKLIIPEIEVEELPTCSKHVANLPSALWRPTSQTISSSEPMSELDDIQGSPMCLDQSLSSETTQSKNNLSLNERMYLCEEYREDILHYLRNLELERRASPNYMLKQTDISYAMRSILIDWLVEVTEEYRMSTETLYLAISYIDRFLSCMSVVRTKLQLVGTAAMFIASKYEEIYPPDVKDFVYITDDTYKKQQVLKTEHLLLKVLGFDLSSPTPYSFLNNFVTGYPVSDEVKYLAMYLMELTLLEGDPYLEYLPSQIAASALLVSRYTVDSCHVLNKKLQQTIDYHLDDLLPCIVCIDRTFRNAERNPRQAINEKYKSEKYLSVSMLTPISPDCSQVIVEADINQDDDDI